ncbi:MAG: rRNA maturation RNase YbeY [Sulfurospirillum sp.]|nr:rRNA maturation RNase YbeY [Sulfurospirillum sp.]
MLEIENTSELELPIGLLEDIACEFTQALVEVIIVSSETMQEINKAQRGIDSTTDVLSFPLEPTPHAPLGSIIINAGLCELKALEYAHSSQEECVLLFIHGLLHLLGFDHEIDDGEMRAKEEEIICKYSLPKSLIVRTQETT